MNEKEKNQAAKLFGKMIVKLLVCQTTNSMLCILQDEPEKQKELIKDIYGEDGLLNKIDSTAEHDNEDPLN